MLEFIHGGRRIAAEIFDQILIAGGNPTP
jgi:hypothetical protein